MNFSDYTKEVLPLAWWNQRPKDEWPHIDPLVYATLKLNGEAGEVAEKIGKLYRDNDGKMDDLIRFQTLHELGDVLWYVAAMAQLIGYSLDDVAQCNIAKLKDRLNRGVLGGSGDNR